MSDMSESSKRSPSPRSGRDAFARLAMARVPHLVHLIDRNPFSPTYGCFDREYWHYRTLDFPCGMSQEFVLPLALLYRNPYPGNRYRGWERLRELTTAGLRFAVKGSRKDGTCDDYFPYERAMGAMVFSTYAGAEAFRILGLRDEELVSFYVKRCLYLEKHNESGKLSNHQALAGLAAFTVFQITGDDRLKRLAQDRVALTLSWQHPTEGWFQEYEGADPGYHTCTVDFLAKYYQKSGDESVLEPLKKAVEFASHFMHPDGSYGGEYGSRNTYHYYPHGFEVLAPFVDTAVRLNDGFLRGVASGKQYAMDDDRLFCHLVYNWLQAYDDFHPDPVGPADPVQHEAGPRITWLPDAGMVCCRGKEYYAVSNLKKGGVIKVFDREGCVGSDTGLTGELEDGRVMVSHLMDQEHEIQASVPEGRFSVEGLFSYRSSKLASPLKLIVFRTINLTFGRFFPDFLRFLLQKVLITGKKRTPYRFRREITFREQSVEIRDELPDAVPLERLAVGPDATSIYVAASNVYQESVLRCPWLYASQEQIKGVRRGGGIWNRAIGGSGRDGWATTHEWAGEGGGEVDGGRRGDPETRRDGGKANLGKRIFGALCVVVSAALVAYLVGRIDMERTGVILRQARYGWLMAAFLVTCCIPFFTVWRWMGVLRAQKEIRVDFFIALRANLMANVLNSLLPSKAGDGAKAVYLRKHGGLARGIGTVILERSVDLMVLGILGITGYWMSGVTWGLLTGLVLIAGISCVFGVVFLVPFQKLPLPPKILDKLETLPHVYKSWIKSPRAVLQTVAASFCCWSMAGLIVCCLVSALNTGVSWGYAYGIFPMAILAGLVPLTMSGVGTRDSAFVFLLAGRMPLEEATLVGLGYTLFAYWLLSLISLPAVFWEIVAYFRSD